MAKKSDLIIRVKYKAIVDDRIVEGVEEEASWFTFDQRGGIYSSSPFHSPTLCNDKYEELTPLIKINDIWLSVKEIEAMIQ